MSKTKLTTLLMAISLLTLSACGFPRAADDYLEKLESLAVKIEQLAQQPSVCQSQVNKIEYRYGHLAPGKNTYLEADFTPDESRQFHQLIERIEAANKKIIRKGNPDC
ncbi:MAG: hypothetical protein CMF12_01710 [Idiomarina sp.]|nr:MULTISPECIES: hypothetical protein [Idiomarina]MBL4742248.1 hypothetical protein [Idiomarina sp.]MBT41217.1 hypothetical protein [Idiomarina sp.]PHQ77122.1 MAG: hypothetical protein COB75_04940 [Idiomarina sp.]